MCEVVTKFLESQNCPLIIKNQLNDWPILGYNLENWAAAFGERKLAFRKGDKIARNAPKWESSCQTVHLTMREFSERSTNSDDWLYFDYKVMSEVFQGTTILDGVKWSNFGRRECSGKDSTFWMGNQGAHTPCHMDTYGYNLVAQVYGRKQWILAPPTETNNRHATRVPYEESSVYSTVDFFVPKKELLTLENVYRAVLEPGDVLLVPRHWWHYVENLDVAISVNIWIPLVGDDTARLEEALVQRFIWSTIQDLPPAEAKAILNPNHYDLLENAPDDAILTEAAKKALSRLKVQDTDKETENEKEIPQKKPKLAGENSRGGKNDPPSLVNDIVRLQPISQEELSAYVVEKGNMYQCDRSSSQSSNSTNPSSIAEMVINSFCHPDTVKLAKDKFLQQMVYIQA